MYQYPHTIVRRWLFSLAVLGSFSLHAQYYYYDDRYYENDLLLETGIAAGAMNCLTDLGGRAGTGKAFLKDFNARNFRNCLSLYLSGSYRNFLALQFKFTTGTVSAADSQLAPVSSTTYGRFERNLSFRSPIRDWQLVSVWFPLKILGIGKAAGRFNPYLLAGLGYFRFNPKAKLGDKWYELQPLHTEGQGFPGFSGTRPYRLLQINVPVGIGVRFDGGPRWALRLDVTDRLLHTDYLDDVSTHYIDPELFAANLPQALAGPAAQLAMRSLSRNNRDPQPGDLRGNPENRDNYFTIEISFSCVLGRKKR